MVVVESSVINEIADRPPKILYVSPNRPDLWDITMRRAFRERGYAMVSVSPGMPLLKGPYVFGLGVYTEEMWGDKQRDLLGLMEHASETAGIEMPESYPTLEAVQRARLPIVVKSPAKHRGEGKILIDSESGRNKFLSLVVAYQNIKSIVSNPDVSQLDRTREVDALMGHTLERVNKGDLTDEERLMGIPRTLVAQEFIDTPGENYASLRVVADATGEVVYGAVFYTPKIPRRRLFDFSRKKSRLEDAVKAASKSDSNMISFLLNDSSPLFIPSSSITSNVSRGGKIFMLGDGAPKSKSLRDTLERIGIDPDNPQIPPSIKERAGLIGKGFAMVAPFVAEDFVLGQLDKRKFLEVNTYPGLKSLVGHRLGVYTEQDGYRYIVWKMLKRIEDHQYQ